MSANGSGLYTIASAGSATNKVLAVEINGDDIDVVVSDDQRSDSQLWRITPLDSGSCRLTSHLLGEGQSLDIVNDDDDRLLRFGTSMNVTGQFWNFDSVNGASADSTLSQCFIESDTSDNEINSNDQGFIPTRDYRSGTNMGRVKPNRKLQWSISYVSGMVVYQWI